MILDKIVSPIDDVITIPYLLLALLLMAFVAVRAVLLEGGLYLFLTKTAFAANKRVFRIPFARGQLRSEIRATLVSILIDGLFIGALVKILPPNTAAHNIGTTFLISAVWFEIWFYASHRILHTKALYFIHKQHHVATVASPFTALSFSAIERLILLTGGLGFIGGLGLLMPIAPFGVALYLFANYLLNLFAHTNLEVVPPVLLKTPFGRILNAPTYHSLHHARYRGHYGLYTPYLDTLFKSRFEDYVAVQKMAYEGRGLTVIHQRIPTEAESAEPESSIGLQPI